MNDLIKRILKYIKKYDYADYYTLVKDFPEIKELDDDTYYDLFDEIVDNTNYILLNNGESFYVNKTKKAIKNFIHHESKEISGNDDAWNTGVVYFYKRREIVNHLSDFYEW